MGCGWVGWGWSRVETWGEGWPGVERALFLSTYVHTKDDVRLYMYIRNLYMYIRKYMRVCIYSYVSVYIYVSLLMYVCMYVRQNLHALQ